MHQALAVRQLPGVAVVSHHEQMCVVATSDVAAGNVVMTIDGRTVAKPNRYTVQIGAGEHVDAEEQSDGSYPVWRFLNHACEPNTKLAGRTLVALVDIRAGDEVTFDYDSTEWDMASPFACACGAATCRGTISGYRHLTAAQRKRLCAIAPHLRAAALRGSKPAARARRQG